jgi:hypothetical protein
MATSSSRMTASLALARVARLRLVSTWLRFNLSVSTALTVVCVLLGLAAARALIDQPNMDAEQIGRKAMQIAADICVYTNHNFVCEMIEDKAEIEKKD